ncbi:unnamed protein product [Closterium sp. NIES-65]|nr:unnamed protein product [Closterium sp. NIES-65]
MLRSSTTSSSHSATAECAAYARRFIQGDWLPLFNEAVAAAVPASRPHNLSSAWSTSTFARLNRAKRFAHCGDWSRSLPQTVRPFFTASTLVALQKPQGGVRPIAIGEILPRLLSRCVILHFKQQIRDFFLPSLQFGVTVSAGIEVMAHTVQSALSLHPDWVVLELNVANAFNLFSRSAMFNALRDSPFSSLIPFFRLFYASPSPLHYRSGPLIEMLQSSSDLTPPSDIVIALNGITVAGVPIGSDTHIISTVQDKLHSFSSSLPLLHDLHDPQTASRILSLCVSARPSFLLRTVAPFPEIDELYTDWDNSLLDHFRPTLVLMNIILVGLLLSFAALLPAAWRYFPPTCGRQQQQWDWERQHSGRWQQ